MTELLSGISYHPDAPSNRVAILSFALSTPESMGCMTRQKPRRDGLSTNYFVEECYR
ncbi:UNVERIFIED_ORG: hypothetical protein J2Y77_000344 [Pseudomonas lini]|uniref:Uncharacterized protein n=1 Tax=Pseudomonas viciae TaxID=2505979 RepID=A0ABY8PHV3_9PSED|nr:hypothetical protein [Pseudomonas viciae]UZE87799.1 hypothetical protein LOY66_06820 [Pseudomonas viciae]WGO94770.1 hypothetical protein QCD61_06715 [Pseudomonas viciae]